MHSALYAGWVSHRRLRAGDARVPLPLSHGSTSTSTSCPRSLGAAGCGPRARPALVRFRRATTSATPTMPLAEAVRDAGRRAHRARARRPDPPAHPPALPSATCFNPVSFYYCFDAAGAALEAVVAEVTNTPWGERHAYVLRLRGARRRGARRVAKAFHVSPFMPMDHDYDWRSAPRGAR